MTRYYVSYTRRGSSEVIETFFESMLARTIFVIRLERDGGHVIDEWVA